MHLNNKMRKIVLAVIFSLLLSMINLVSAFPNYSSELYEGGPCEMENGEGFGTCVELPSCPMRIKQVISRKRFSTASGRCSFKDKIEIVCCPNQDARSNNNNNIHEKLGLRPANVACHEYEDEILGEDGQKINPNIFNGERAAFGEFPYMVALGYHSDDGNIQLTKYSCGGTLISTSYVLTAAHCVSNVNNYIPYEVRLGATNLLDNSDSVQRITISEIIPHPRYKRSQNYYDIAVLKLQHKVNVSEVVMPICLQNKPIPNLSQLINMSLIVTGWGATNFENESSNNLQKTPHLKVIEKAECNKSYKGFSKLPRGIDESMICMLDTNTTRRSDACQGDSGGPLLLLSKVSKTVLGVTSFGQSCSSSTPAVYTSVFHYLDWIEEVVWPNKK